MKSRWDLMRPCLSRNFLSKKSMFPSNHVSPNRRLRKRYAPCLRPSLHLSLALSTPRTKLITRQFPDPPWLLLGRILSVHKYGSQLKGRPAMATLEDIGQMVRREMKGEKMVT